MWPWFTSPTLLLGGSARGYSHALAATLLMWYSEHKKAQECHQVRVHMTECLVQLGYAKGVFEADNVLLQWSNCLKAAFDTANLHLRTKAKVGGVEQVIAVVQQQVHPCVV